MNLRNWRRGWDIMFFRLLLSTILITIFLTGCSSIRKREYFEHHEKISFCTMKLSGNVNVYLKTNFRKDLKNKEIRKSIFKKTTKKFFKNLKCGNKTIFHIIGDENSDIREYDSPYHLTITLEEIGPHLLISIPILWSTYSEIIVRFEFNDSESSLFEGRVDYLKGGPFIIRGEDVLSDTLYEVYNLYN